MTPAAPSSARGLSMKCDPSRAHPAGLDGLMATPLTIIPYTDALAPHFHAINAAWIETMFVLEPHDEEVLADPRTHIIDKGGIVLFAATPDGAIVGAGALMPTAPGCYELTKMGVRKEARGSGAGAALLAALIEHAARLPDCDMLYLLTSRKCEAAIHLYEKAGFAHDPAVMARFGGDYARCDVAMRLAERTGGANPRGAASHTPVDLTPSPSPS